MRAAEFSELRAFLAIVEQGNFSRAAISLGIAASTLSQTIRALESRLGVRLLQRTTRSVSLTEAGEHLMTRIRPIFESLELAIESINDFRDTPMGSLRLSVSSVAAKIILAPMLKTFLESYPAINLEVDVDNASIDIVKGRYDAGIRYGKKIAQDMVLIKASPPSRIIAVAAPAYLAQNGTPKTPHELQQHSCIQYRHHDQQLSQWSFEKDGQKIEMGVNGPLTVNNIDLMIAAAKDGIGICYMAEIYLREDIEQGHLVPMLTDWAPVYDSWYLYYTRQTHISAPLKAFIHFLREYRNKMHW